MNVLVTGATGFLGGHLVNACIEKHDNVRALVRRSSSVDFIKNHPDVDIAYGDVTDQASLTAACRDIEVVYHCAARSLQWGSWEQFYNANELGTYNVVNACLDSHVRRLVHISSPSTVFDYTDQINIDESYPFPRRFANFYCRTKAAAERFVLASNGTHGLSTVALRPHAIWGPRDKGGFLPQILSAVVSGRFKKITDGKKRVLTDFCHVKNAVHASLLAAQSSLGGKVYFITDGETLGTWEALDLFCDACGIGRVKKTMFPAVAQAAGAVMDFLWKIPALVDNYKPPITRYTVGVLTCSTTYKIDAANRDLGYEPQITLSQGLSQLSSWVKEIGGVHEFVKHA
jgi:2-alkyl-3-oxoalkanoate reductase